MCAFICVPVHVCAHVWEGNLQSSKGRIFLGKAKHRGVEVVSGPREKWPKVGSLSQNLQVCTKKQTVLGTRERVTAAAGTVI